MADDHSKNPPPMEILFFGDDPSALHARLQAALGPSIRIHSASDDNAALTLAPHVDVIISGHVQAELLAAALRLRYVIVPWAGVPQRLRENLAPYPHITVLNSHYNARYAAEHAWALLLAAAKRIVSAHNRLAEGDWTPRYEGPLSAGLAGKTLLLIGYGAIGRALARMAHGFDMHVRAIKRTDATPQSQEPGVETIGTLEDLPAFLPDADAIILSLPDTPSTAGRIGAREFAAMKPGVILVNVGRGTAVDEDAFFAALESGRVGAAGIDTWWSYPSDEGARTKTRPSRLPLARFEKVVMSPHRASHVEGREEARIDDLARLLQSIASGRPCNVVDRKEWY